ncbi:MAG: ABC transporter substrate-binding protein [Heteroscytonema crispum UTEX LB 1556]
MNSSPPSSTVIYRLSRRKLIQYNSVLIGIKILAACTNQKLVPSEKSRLDKVTFGTNWVAQAEHGGFYQAIATGSYKDYNLDITIKMGSPQVPSPTQLLMGGAVNFFMGYGINAVNAVAQRIPKITVAAGNFSKRPPVSYRPS